jgi:hypothetical protein
MQESTMRHEFARLIAMVLLVLHGAGGLAPRVVCIADGACLDPLGGWGEVCGDECDRRAGGAGEVGACVRDGPAPGDQGRCEDEWCDCCRRLPVPGDQRLPLPQIKGTADAERLLPAWPVVAALVRPEVSAARPLAGSRSPHPRARDQALSLRSTRLLI